MGVHRITSLLHKQNWIPTDSQQQPQVDAACRLWKDWNPSTSFLHQGLPIQAIPAESLLLIDGNGLGFYLFKVAYARYLRSILATHQDDSFPDIKSLEPSDLTKALPCMMPLNRLEDVTREFSSHLRLCSQTVQVRLCRFSVNANAIAAQPPGRRQFQSALQGAIIGQKQQSL